MCYDEPDDFMQRWAGHYCALPAYNLCRILGEFWKTKKYLNKNTMQECLYAQSDTERAILSWQSNVILQVLIHYPRILSAFLLNTYCLYHVISFISSLTMISTLVRGIIPNSTFIWVLHNLKCSFTIFKCYCQAPGPGPGPCLVLPW